MATFVLVHGGWHGGWCWKKVRERLQKEGHTVFTPTLTGLGERSHLANKDIDLDTHVTDIVNVLFYEDLHDVILVGHSYGGMIITGVAESVPDRIKHLVYLDGLRPKDGQSIADIFPKETIERFEHVVEEREDHGIPPTEGSYPWGVTEKADLEWLDAHITPHPIGVLYTKVRYRNPQTLKIPRTYIGCRGRSEDRKKEVEERGFRYNEIETGHDAMITAPDETTEMLIEISK